MSKGAHHNVRSRLAPREGTKLRSALEFVLRGEEFGLAEVSSKEREALEMFHSVVFSRIARGRYVATGVLDSDGRILSLPVASVALGLSPSSGPR